MAVTSKLDVINQALVRIGANRVPSLADGDAEAIAASEMYDTVVQSELAMTEWNFALRGANLPQLAWPTNQHRPFEKFEYVYQLPEDYVRILGLESHMRFKISKDHLFTNDDKASLVYIFDAPPSQWKAYFTNVVVHELAAAFAIAVTDITSRQQLYKQQSARFRALAMGIDAQQTPPEVYELMRVYLRPTHNPLVS